MNRIEAKEAYTSVLYEDVIFACPKFGLCPVVMCVAIFKCYDPAAPICFFIF